MSKQYLAGRFASKTDIGKVRPMNDDAVLALCNSQGNYLFAICDGMGGEKKGNVASSLAINHLKEEFLKKEKFANHIAAYNWAIKATKEANSLIYDFANKNHECNRMGTTLSLVLLVNNFALMVHVGDSRIYFLKNKKLVQMTEDQTYVAYLYRTGQISKEDMLTHPKRHVLINVLGKYPTANLTCRIVKYKKEPILLCSDGVYNNVKENILETIMLSNGTVDEKVEEIISIGNSNGGSDNMGIVIWEAK